MKEEMIEDQAFLFRAEDTTWLVVIFDEFSGTWEVYQLPEECIYTSL